VSNRLSTGQKWHTHRKMITPTFHFKILDSFVEVFSEKSEILISKLRKEVGSQGFDVYPYITKCTLDIICETAMGTPINAQGDKDSEYVSAVYKMSEVIVHRMLRPWLSPDCIFKLTAAGKRHEKCLRVLHGFTNRRCVYNLASVRYLSFTSTGRKRRLAFLDLLLEASHDGIMLTDEELREEVDTFMFEGHDTTSAGICWTIYLLGLHTDIQNKVSEELDHIFHGSDRSVTMKDLNEMKYLERVIKESLRLYPSVPFIGRETTQDIEHEYTIPAGVTMTVPIYGIHRNPDQFPNPEKFNPDNFLPERVAKRHPYAYIPFSAGPRNCIGQKFAMLEMKTVLSCILRHYRLSSIDRREDITLIAELILRPDEGVKVIITPRDGLYVEKQEYNAMEAVTILLGGALFIIALLFLLTANKKETEFATRVNKLHGPTRYPIVGTDLSYVFLKRTELFKHALMIEQKFSPIFRTWTANKPQVHLLQPEDVGVILRSSEHLDKTEPYEFLQDWLGTGLLTSTGQKWHSHRKMITPTFHFTILDSFVEVFSEKGEILISKLRKEVGSQGFNICPYITKCTLDIICETAMGTPVHAQDDRGSDYVKAVHDMGEIIINRLFRPWLYLNFIFKMSAIGRRNDECLRVLHGFTNKMIQERKNAVGNLPNKTDTSLTEEDSYSQKRRKASLDLLLEALHNGATMTDQDVREEVDTLMFAGHDTTSAALCWTLFLLGLHPDVQETAYQEQESIFQGSDRSVTMKDLNEMKYLERVIKETLRLYPSVPVIGRLLKKAVSTGYDIPSGCTVVMHIYGVHRNPVQFPNPEKFDPDNFLPERVAKRHPYAYIPFSAGPRNCIGQKFAMLEMKTVLSCMLRHYRLRSLDNRDTVILLAEIVLKSDRGINVTITPRQTRNGG
ncbi:hypothetical protein Cfor_02942, partial [Coptotermes formosanus]